MNGFKIVVSGIQRKEYFQACRESGRRIYGLLALSMLVFCGLIIIFSGNVSVASILGPVIIYVVVVALYELLPRVTYKGGLDVIDPPVEYEFSSSGWHVQKGDVSAEIEWRATPRLHKTKSCVFLYNDETTSNLIPLRLLSEGQLHSIENWYGLSREKYKLYRKEKDKADREQFRKDHPGLRLGRTGPAWGPRKRR